MLMIVFYGIYIQDEEKKQIQTFFASRLLAQGYFHYERNALSIILYLNQYQQSRFRKKNLFL